METNMTPLDYGRSFLIGKDPGNEVRFWVESRTRVIDDASGTTEDYIQCGSCKSEDTFAERELLLEDNYDFLVIFGPEDGVIFRRKAWLNPGYRSRGKSRQMWGGLIYRLCEAPSAEELPTTESIVSATHAARPIVAQTEIHDRDAGLRAIIEYPAKTINIHKGKHMYQIDTGPVPFPDLARWREAQIDALSLAFVVFNAPHFADFVIEAPTSLNPGGTAEDGAAMVYHYSERVSLEAKNRVYALA